MKSVMLIRKWGLLLSMKSNYYTEEPKKYFFTIPGNPFGKERPLVVRRGRFSRGIKRPKTRQYENMTRTLWKSNYQGTYDVENAINLDIKAYYQIPASWAKWKKEAAKQGVIRPVHKSRIKPDVDNVAKMIMDSFNQEELNRKHVPNTGLYKDDGQVVHLSVDSWYSDEPRVEATLTVLPLMDIEEVKKAMQEIKKKKTHR